MSATRRDPLAGWRAARAARPGDAPAVASTVATVATMFPEVATPGEAQKSAVVATVSSVSSQSGQEFIETPSRDAWGLTETERAEGLVRLLGATPAAPAMDHDEGEQAARIAFYRGELNSTPYAPGDPDPLRDGLHRGFHAHRPASRAPPVMEDAPAPAAVPRQQPRGCSICGSRRRWCRTGEPLTELRCWTCHPPDHLQPNQIHEVST